VTIVARFAIEMVAARPMMNKNGCHTACTAKCHSLGLPGSIFSNNQRRAFSAWRCSPMILILYCRITIDSNILLIQSCQQTRLKSVVSLYLWPRVYSTGRGHCLTPLMQVCIALRYYATDCMQLSLGAWMNVDQSTVSRCIWRVSQGVKRVYGRFLAIGDVTSVKQRFFEKFGFPNTIGCIDGTQIKIIKPSFTQHPSEYINRKGFYSINIQAVCDSDCYFWDVLAAWPGSVYDSRIFKNSSALRSLLGGNLNGILFGDKGYGICPFLLTPYYRPANPIQQEYNRRHAKTRNTIERAFGQLKLTCVDIEKCVDSQHPSIKFEFQHPADPNSSKLSLLDITITMNESEATQFEFYKKSAKGELFINYESVLPSLLKTNVIKDERNRINLRCSTQESGQLFNQKLDNFLTKNNYPVHCIEQTYQTNRKSNRLRQNTTRFFYIKFLFISDVLNWK
jgi:hypothetical protein